MANLSMFAYVIVLLILSNDWRAQADMVEVMIAMINGSPSSALLGERHDLKHMVPDRPEIDELLFDATTEEIIEETGFLSETHMLSSSDGYMTELINIINPLADRDKLKQPPVMLFHGALADASSWISGGVRQHHPESYPRDPRHHGPMKSSNRSLAFTLANNGYDVWLVATRGSNRQNMGHIHYSTETLDILLGDSPLGPNYKQAQRFIDTLRYLDFSQDQLVEIEYPQQINQVLRLTGSQKVSVIAYSKATQIMFKVLASDPVSSQRIHSFVALAPILNNVGTSNFWKVVGGAAMKFPNQMGNLVYSQLLASSWTRRIMASIQPHTWYHYIMTLVAGPSPRYRTSTESSVLGHFLTGESFTEAKHYMQQVLAGKLQKYDHGQQDNRVIYGSVAPPEYNITNIKLERWMMISGQQDALGTPDSSRKYYDLVPTKPDTWIELDNCNHVDLIFALDADVTVNLPVLKFLDNYKMV